jgi:glycosyltransferase involved in cell wall biosynthesis
MNPFFSIVIATYNRENLITRAIDSVVNQDTNDWELIIVDDCSLDKTFDRIKSFFSDERIFYFKTKKNSGVAKARNLGISKSIGRYITFLDSDDEYKKNHLSVRYDLLENQNIDLLHGGVEIIGNRKVPDKNDKNKLIDISKCIIGGTFFINSNIDENLKLFDEKIDYSEDSELFEKFTRKNMKIQKTDYQTYIYYRDTEDSICNTVNE